MKYSSFAIAFVTNHFILAFEVKLNVNFGSSGSPVVSEKSGKLIGVVSHFSRAQYVYDLPNCFGHIGVFDINLPSCLERWKQFYKSKYIVSPLEDIVHGITVKRFRENLNLLWNDTKLRLMGFALFSNFFLALFLLHFMNKI